MKLKYFLFALPASCLIYIVIFTFIVHKPLTVGIMQNYYEKKLSYLTSIDSKKIILLAGSNGRFSHRCETIELELGVPCINMSISADLSLDYQFEKIKSYAKAGDIIYLPLEYGKLSATKKDVMSSAEIPYIMAYDHNFLTQFKFEQLMYSVFYFDVKFLISGIGEMLLDKMGVKRRFSIDTMTNQGDESMHTIYKAENYKSYISNLSWNLPLPNVINEASYGSKVIVDFMRWATAQEITVVGGLPTTFNDQPISDDLIEKMKNFYEDNGHKFIVLENRSQYSRSSFYDTSYHLAEEFQIIHSIILAKHFKKILYANSE